MGMTALACLCLGIFPTVMINWMDAVSVMLVRGKLAESAGAFGRPWLTPIPPLRATYSGPSQPHGYGDDGAPATALRM